MDIFVAIIFALLIGCIRNKVQGSNYGISNEKDGK